MEFRPRIMVEERIEARVLLTNRIARKGREITNRNIAKEEIQSV